MQEELDSITKKLSSSLVVEQIKKNLLDNLVGAIGTLLVITTPNTTLRLIIALPIIVFLMYRYNINKKEQERLQKKYSL
jgi:hypothetical protein